MDWPEDLVLELARKKCVLFLGSGISANAVDADGHHPPTWHQFLEEGKNNIKNPDKDTIERCIGNYEYLMACELLRRKLGKDKFDELLKNMFRGKGFDHAPIHEYIFSLDSRITITPNFDKIYDNYAQTKSHNTIVLKHYYDKDIVKYIRGKDSVIIKNHGTIDTTDKIVFTQSDYAKSRIGNSDFYQIMEALIITHTFVFLGAGLNDPDIKLLFENYATTFNVSKNHYFVIPKNIYSELELQVYNETMHLDFIKYDPADNHKELTEGLKELSTMVENKKLQVRDNLWW